jgi:hypothetical protein
VGGLSIASAVLQSSLKRQLRISLEGRDGREEIIERALSDIDYVIGPKGRLGDLVTAAYVQCLTDTHGISLIGAIVALIAVLSIREHDL